MATYDPMIDPAAARQAHRMQALFPLMRVLFVNSPQLRFATKKIAKPTRITIPTRHGDIGALVYSPTARDIEAQLAAGHRPPVHLITHGGGFILRTPKQEDNVAQYLASEVGCFVVIPDYDAAPQVRFPVEEEESYDAFRWIHAHGGEFGWDQDRITVGGASAGGKLALNVALMAIDDGHYVPLAVSSEYGASDMSIPDEQRTSTKKNPIVGRGLMTLIRKTYFLGADLTDPLASPALHPRLAELPPTLIETAELDTLKHESNALAAEPVRRGVDVTHREFAGVDHAFTHAKPVEVAREAITMIGDHLRKAFASAL
ncbi:alpha/beta hydrolase [Plantibacter sp. Mn2098]|uniref:alpha/beta hydrolase n=1 Tax=Plantibacter sp. Mn2098 TaxID=3395266 RepID=UPI003BE7E275